MNEISSTVAPFESQIKSTTANSAPSIQRHIERKKNYISDVLEEAIEHTINNMSHESINDTFESVTANNDVIPKIAESLAKAIVDIGTSSTHVDLKPTNIVFSTDSPIIIDFEKTYSTGEASKLVGCGINTVKNRIKNLKLLGYRCHDKDEYRLPQWQFMNQSVVKGVNLVLEQLNQNGIPAVRKFTLPLMDYDDKCIIDTLRQGDVELALEMAATLKD